MDDNTTGAIVFGIFMLGMIIFAWIDRGNRKQ